MSAQYSAFGVQSLVADGTEQVFVSNSLGSGYGTTIRTSVDLSEMQDGDTVILRAYSNLGEASTEFRLVWAQTFTGVQAAPLPRLPDVLAVDAFKFSLQQTTGPFRSFQWNAFSPGSVVDAMSGTLLDILGFERAQSDSMNTIAGQITALSGGIVTIVNQVVNGVGLSNEALTAVANAVLDQANGVETSHTVRQSLRLVLAVLFGKTSGVGRNTITYKDINGVVTRLVITHDRFGDRTDVQIRQ